MRPWDHGARRSHPEMVPHMRPTVCPSAPSPTRQPRGHMVPDEVFLTSTGQRHSLWRAVDQDGHGRDILVQRRRDKDAAKRVFRQLLTGCHYIPRVIITDTLQSDSAAKREVLPSMEHRQHRYWNTRAEHSHHPPPPTRTAHAGVEVARAGPAFPGRRWSDCPTCPAATSSRVRSGLPAREAAKMRHLAGHHAPPQGSIRVMTEAVVYLPAR